MTKWVLGISAFYHDSAAVILRDGEIVAAAQEERFSRKKHDPRFPIHAINYCMEEAFIEPDELANIAYYDDGLLTWERVLSSAVAGGENAKGMFKDAARTVLGHKIWVRDAINKALGEEVADVKLSICDHHASHAASAFYPSPFQDAAILTTDGVGEWSTMTLSHGTGQNIEVLKEIRYPHSIGLLYSAVTAFCGFKVNSGEYKLMGLAPYGEPIYYERMRDKLIDVKADGSFRLNMDYFGYLQQENMTNDAFARLFDGPGRTPESGIGRREMDIAASVQKVTEEVVLSTATHLKELTKSGNLVMAGGVALNCVANGKLSLTGLYDQVWVQPAAGDAGGALGAAYLASHSVLKLPRVMKREKKDAQMGSLLGPSYSDDEIKAFLDRHNYPYEYVAENNKLYQKISTQLAAGKIVGFFQGRMEFGPRALGARSIVGDARNPEMQTRMNLKIKYRESFRPFAPAVLAEDIKDYFELDQESPYMLLVGQVARERCLPTNRESWWHENEDMLSIIRRPRSDVPAITHVDHSARVQSVDEERNPGFYGLLKAFKEQTGCSVLVNTSFNVRGEPIVSSPDDAYRCFMRTEIDILVLENSILLKEEQPKYSESHNWRDEFELD